MAMLDYGTVVKRNGQIINENETFFASKGAPKTALNIDYSPIEREDVLGNYTIIGEDDFFIAIYKEYTCLLYRLEKEKDFKISVLRSSAQDSEINFIYYDLRMWKTPNQQHRISFKIHSNVYDILYGYGIDSNYQTQLDCAMTYGITIQGIEEISEFWGRPVLVSGIGKRKVEYSSSCKAFTRYYKYTPIKNYYQLIMRYADKNYEDNLCEVSLQYNTLEAGLNALSKVPKEMINHFNQHGVGHTALFFLKQIIISNDETYEYNSDHMKQILINKKFIVMKEGK